MWSVRSPHMDADQAAPRDRVARFAFTFLGASLLLIPSRLVFAPLGSAGTVAQVTGLVLVVWWLQAQVMGRWRKRLPLTGVAVLVYLASTLASYVAAVRRPIAPIEISAADRGLISALAYTGIVLALIDGIEARATLDVVLRRLVAFGGAIGLLGMIQFATGILFIDYIDIPGLTPNYALGGVDSRAGLNRPSGTAIHPIEFGAVLTMLLPLALHYALHDENRSALKRWAPVAAMAGSIGVCISRSALVSAFVVLVVLLPTWSPGLRRRAYVAVVGAGAVFYLLVPGMLGTIASLFVGIGGDTSAQSRTDSAAIALEFFPRSPLFGRGARTFLPSYRILDNQYLLSLIETGLVGVAALLFVVGAAVGCAYAARRRAADAATRSLAMSLIASIVTAAVSTSLYDAFSFPMAVTLFFVMVGAAGTLKRLVPIPSHQPTDAFQFRQISTSEREIP